MKQNIDLNKMGMAPLTEQELLESDGGFIWLLAIAAVALISGCVQKNTNSGTGVQTNIQINAQNVGDTISNKNQATLQVSPK